jgi:hypothetical protein
VVRPDLNRYAHDVKVSNAALKPTQDVVVEVLVGEESSHRPAGV